MLAFDSAAHTDIPGFDRSVVDGYAVRSTDTTRAGYPVPVPQATQHYSDKYFLMSLRCISKMV